MKTLKEQIREWDQPICKNCFDRGHTEQECTIPHEDLELVHKIAAFIGSRLNYILPECNSGIRGGKPVSTIKVEQHKEKFFYARVYCKLAEPSLVHEKWLAERQRESEGEEPSQEFKDKCFRLDAWHYRTCYLDMIQIIPRLKRRIRSQSDYSELLFDDVREMTERIDKMAEIDPEFPQRDNLVILRQKYKVSTNEELKAKLAKYLERPSYREWNGDA